jgi:proteasome lid subunit RPN8/RPN11
MDAEILTFIRLHAAEVYPCECCGLVLDLGNNRFLAVKCVNLYPDLPLTEITPKNPVKSARIDFLIDPLAIIDAEKQGKIVAVYHSHPDGSAVFTAADIVASEETGYPYLVVESPGSGWATYAPKGFQCQLIGRAFIYGVYDCYTLVRDWHLARGIVFPPGVVKDYGWWTEHANEDYYLNGLRNIGFVPTDALEPGNVILMTYRTKVPNHLAIYEGDGYILHHLSGRRSELAVYGGQWALNTRNILRHPQLK